LAVHHQPKTRCAHASVLGSPPRTVILTPPRSSRQPWTQPLRRDGLKSAATLVTGRVVSALTGGCVAAGWICLGAGAHSGERVFRASGDNAFAVCLRSSAGSKRTAMRARRRPRTATVSSISIGPYRLVSRGGLGSGP